MHHSPVHLERANLPVLYMLAGGGLGGEAADRFQDVLFVEAYRIVRVSLWSRRVGWTTESARVCVGVHSGVGCRERNLRQCKSFLMGAVLTQPSSSGTGQVFDMMSKRTKGCGTREVTPCARDVSCKRTLCLLRDFPICICTEMARGSRRAARVCRHQDFGCLTSAVSGVVRPKTSRPCTFFARKCCENRT